MCPVVDLRYDDADGKEYQQKYEDDDQMRFRRIRIGVPAENLDAESSNDSELWTGRTGLQDMHSVRCHLCTALQIVQQLHDDLYC